MGSTDGLPPDPVPHDLRDTAASLMISSGATIKAVQRQLGQTSAKVTLDTHGSRYDEDLEALCDRLEERDWSRNGGRGDFDPTDWLGCSPCSPR